MHKAIIELYNEHLVILEALDAADNAGALLKTSPEKYASTVQQLIHFFRSYADQYHHHKEEEILFPEMCKRNELVEDGVIKEMLENHNDFRDMLRAVEAFLEKKDFARAQQQLGLYADALRDHIAVENDEVFTMAETMFSQKELEMMFFRFQDCDSDLGAERKTNFEHEINRLQSQGNGR